MGGPFASDGPVALAEMGSELMRWEDAPNYQHRDGCCTRAYYQYEITRFSVSAADGLGSFEGSP